MNIEGVAYMRELTEGQRKALNDNLPREAVASRSQAGRSLSYVEGWWVMDRLNAILGPGGWSYDATDTHEAVREKRPNPKNQSEERWHVTYRAKCRLLVGGAHYCDVGTGHGIDKDLGAAIESAEKEAATDAFKRCAKSLGRSLGLALYDKQQEHVGEKARTPDDEAADIIDALFDAKTMEEVAHAKKRYQAVSRHLSSESQSRVKAAGVDAKARIEAAMAGEERA